MRTLVLNRPERRNALSHALLNDLIAALAETAADTSVHAVIVRGEGPGFCAGHDLSEMAGCSLPSARGLFETCSEMMMAIHRLPQPVIAQVHGIATAAGCQLVAACDLAIASEDARFATSGVRYGLFCSTPMVEVSRADRAQARARDAAHRRHDRRADGGRLGPRQPRRAARAPGGGDARTGRRASRRRARTRWRSARSRSTSRSTAGCPRPTSTRPKSWRPTSWPRTGARASTRSWASASRTGAAAKPS